MSRFNNFLFRSSLLAMDRYFTIPEIIELDKDRYFTMPEIIELDMDRYFTMPEIIELDMDRYFMMPEIRPRLPNNLRSFSCQVKKSVCDSCKNRESFFLQSPKRLKCLSASWMPIWRTREFPLNITEIHSK